MGSESDPGAQDEALVPLGDPSTLQPSDVNVLCFYPLNDYWSFSPANDDGRIESTASAWNQVNGAFRPAAEAFARVSRLVAPTQPSDSTTATHAQRRTVPDIIHGQPGRERELVVLRARVVGIDNPLVEEVYTNEPEHDHRGREQPSKLAALRSDIETERVAQVTARDGAELNLRSGTGGGGARSPSREQVKYDRAVARLAVLDASLAVIDRAMAGEITLSKRTNNSDESKLTMCAQIFDAIASLPEGSADGQGPLRAIAFCCHGFSGGMQLGGFSTRLRFPRRQADHPSSWERWQSAPFDTGPRGQSKLVREMLVELLRKRSQADLVVRFYCCLTAKDFDKTADFPGASSAPSTASGCDDIVADPNDLPIARWTHDALVNAGLGACRVTGHYTSGHAVTNPRQVRFDADAPKGRAIVKWSGFVGGGVDAEWSDEWSAGLRGVPWKSEDSPGSAGYYPDPNWAYLSPWMSLLQIDEAVRTWPQSFGVYRPPQSPRARRRSSR